MQLIDIFLQVTNLKGNNMNIESHAAHICIYTYNMN